MRFQKKNIRWLRKKEKNMGSVGFELTGNGFREVSKLKNWRNITKADFDKRIQRLIEITQTENPEY